MGQHSCGALGRCADAEEATCGDQGFFATKEFDQPAAVPSIPRVYHDIMLIQGLDETNVISLRVSQPLVYDILIATNTVTSLFFERTLSFVAILCTTKPNFTEHRQASCALLSQVQYPSWLCFAMQYTEFATLESHVAQSSMSKLLLEEWPRTLPRPDSAMNSGSSSSANSLGPSPGEMLNYMPLVSSSFGRGRRIRVPQDYPTIQAAIDAAESADTVAVSAGVYEERLVVSRNIEIVGVLGPDGDRPEVAASGIGHVVEFATVEAQPGAVQSLNPAMMHHISVRHRGQAHDGLPYGAVLVGPGGVLMQDCSVCSRGGAGVYVEGSGVSCQLERCRVEGCKQAGVLVNHCAQALLNDCTVTQNGSHGVCIQRGGQVLVISSAITHNHAYGVAAVDTSNRGTAAVVENNNLTNNDTGPLYVDEVCSSRIKQKKNQGISI